MKKYIILAISTIIFISVFTIAAQIIKNDVTYVSIKKFSAVDVENTVVSTGNIEYKVNKKLYSSSIGKVERIYVKNGDYVKKGDLVAEILTGNNSSIYTGEKESVLASQDLSKFENISTEDIYQQLLLGNYDILDDYDKYLSNYNISDNKNITQVNNENKINSLIKIYANENGTVTNINYFNNDFISTTKELFTIISQDKFNVKLQISEDKISKIKIGQPVEVCSIALNDTILNGKISNIDDEAKQKTTATGKDTTIEVTVSIKQNNNLLKNGYSAKCSIITDSKNDVYLIPYEFINVNENGEEYIYIYNNGIANIKKINTINEYTKGVEIADNINKNDYIIDCSVHLNDGEFVKIASESKVN